MLRRTRTTKKLARRIDLQYFSRPHPFRRWRFWLSVAVPTLALGWLLTQRAQGGQKIYSSGQLSRSHAVFTQQCGLCHVTRAGTFFKEVRDQSCLTCHDGPVHHSSQTFSPNCSSCHVEHKGVQRLSATSDASCTQCHSHLRTRDGQPHYAGSISGFDRSHPELSPLAKGKIDPGQIKLNHYLHLQPNLVGPANQRVQMTCDDCHRAASDNGVWPYGAPGQNATVEQVSSQISGPRRYITPIQFAKHCAACHTLQFDRRLATSRSRMIGPISSMRSSPRDLQNMWQLIRPPSTRSNRRTGNCRNATASRAWRTIAKNGCSSECKMPNGCYGPRLANNATFLISELELCLK